MLQIGELWRLAAQCRTYRFVIQMLVFSDAPDYDHGVHFSAHLYASHVAEIGYSIIVYVSWVIWSISSMSMPMSK